MSGSRNAESPAGVHRTQRSASHRGRSDSPSVKPVDDEQQFLWNQPRVRNHIDSRGSVVRDPDTSVSAARSVSPETITATQRGILNALRIARRPMSDEEIIESLSWMKASESGIRSRRAELLRAGRIEVSDELGVTKHSRACRRYRIAGAG